GIANAFEMPMRQTLLKEMVEDRALMTSAIAMSALVFNLGRMVGPAIGGVLLIYVSEGFAASLAVLGSFPAVRYLLPTMIAIGLCATAYVPLMPSIVAHFFDGQSSTVGLLMSAAGVGALVVSIYLALQPGFSRQLRLVTIAPLAVGASLAGFAWSRSLPLSLLLLASMAG